VPFAEHSRRALAATYAGRGLVVDASGVAADTAALLARLPDWLLGPDVAAALPGIARQHRVDPDDPQPRHEVADLGELPAVLARNAPA
jgi:hypothetical protein